MPLFEFRCPACRHEFEALVRSNEEPVCPRCAERTLEKLMSSTAGRISRSRLLPIESVCPPADAPPCSPYCCRLPGNGAQNR